jgi:TRAP-type C4-dicarboxylate transport system permease small subunit
VVAEIVARQGFSYSLHWAIEYTEYFVPILALWGAAYTLRKEGHVNADVVLHLFGFRTRQWLVMIGYVLGLGFSVILVRELFNLALSNIELGLLSLYPSETPYGYLQLFLAIGFALFNLQLVIEIVRKGRRLFLTYKGIIKEEVREIKIAED